MRKNKITLKNLVYNDTVIAVFSVIAAFAVWLTITIIYSPEDERTIENVPVSIELSQAMKTYGLTSFGEDNYFVDVTVHGKRYEVSPSALKAEDIVVKANTSHVNAAGRYTLQLVASSKSARSNYEIASLSIDVVDVYFDVEKTKEFQIYSNIVAPSGVVPEGYYAGEPALSESTIRITGPETEVDKISGVNATVNIDRPLTSTQTFNCSVAAYNPAGNEPDYLTYKSNQSAVTLTMPVYKVDTLSTGLDFVNSPAAYISSPLSYSISPAVARFGVAESRLESLNGVMPVATIDFSSIGAGKQTFNVEFSSESAILIDEKITGFTITVDPGDVVEKVIEIPTSAVEVSDTQRGGNVPVITTDKVAVTVIGPAASLEKLDVNSVTLKINSSDVSEDTVSEVPLTVTIKDFPDCWVYGTYTVKAVA